VAGVNVPPDGESTRVCLLNRVVAKGEGPFCPIVVVLRAEGDRAVRRVESEYVGCGPGESLSYYDVVCVLCVI